MEVYLHKKPCPDIFINKVLNLDINCYETRYD